ncbi:MAG: PEP-CTERM sorting domain-containing protein [Planctomycetes bacterium]|nr:PEP-CTERM sorting domain-containing protein [Planctomycetota bacterium]
MAGEVPEPATVVMICLGGMLLLKRRSSPLRA